MELEKKEKRAIKLIKKKKIFKKDELAMVALSSGKDSVMALYLTKKLHNKVMALHIEIEKEARKMVEKQASLLEVPLVIEKFEKVGFSLEEIALKLKEKRLSRPICSICGATKRYLLNKIAREIGEKEKKQVVLVTGHHMDDFIVSFLRNLSSKNLEWSSKFMPRIEKNNKLVARARPLFYLGAREIIGLCKKYSLPYLAMPCKFYEQKIDKKREWLYKKIYEIEKGIKDFRFNLIQGIEELANLLERKIKREPLRECKLCKEPTDQEICSVCKMIRLLKK